MTAREQTAFALSVASATAAFLAERLRHGLDEFAGTEMHGETAVIVHHAVKSFFDGPGRALLRPNGSVSPTNT
ncbi:MAG: hypothetical protein K8U57_21530 [Planctomycetes bacterium]|nr:hypothetical protein [Planctomycetota bacterium]